MGRFPAEGRRIVDALESFNDLPIAIPACGHGGHNLTTAQCWHGTSAGTRCHLSSDSTVGLCNAHLVEMRAETS